MIIPFIAIPGEVRPAGARRVRVRSDPIFVVKDAALRGGHGMSGPAHTVRRCRDDGIGGLAASATHAVAIINRSIRVHRDGGIEAETISHDRDTARRPAHGCG